MTAPRTAAQRAAKADYDRARRKAYAPRRKELEQTPTRVAARSAYLKKWRAKPASALALLLANAKYRANNRGIPFALSVADVEMPTACPVLGISFVHGNGDSSFTARDCAPSLDRLDNAKGYVPGNVRVISWRANRLKNDATIAELEAVIRYMKESVR